jgi:hypothetical protein
LKDTLAFHAGRIAGLPVVPFIAARVPQVILAFNAERLEFNLARGRYIPLSAQELEQIHAAMRGEWAKPGNKPPPVITPEIEQVARARFNPVEKRGKSSAIRPADGGVREEGDG